MSLSFSPLRLRYLFCVWSGRCDHYFGMRVSGSDKHLKDTGDSQSSEDCFNEKEIKWNRGDEFPHDENQNEWKNHICLLSRCGRRSGATFMRGFSDNRSCLLLSIDVLRAWLQIHPTHTACAALTCAEIRRRRRDVAFQRTAYESKAHFKHELFIAPIPFQYEAFLSVIANWPVMNQIKTLGNIRSQSTQILLCTLLTLSGGTEATQGSQADARHRKLLWNSNLTVHKFGGKTKRD